MKEELQPVLIEEPKIPGSEKEALVFDVENNRDNNMEVNQWENLSGHDKLATAKEKLIDFLKQEKILENIDGYEVIDFNKFFNPGFIVNKLQHLHLGKIDGKKVQGSYKLIFEQMGDMPVVSKEDFEAQKEKGESIKTKPLFNVPASLNEALDGKKVKQDDYYLNYWDLKDPSRPLQINWQYKIKLKNGEEINASELGLFTKVFKDHKGRRDENGVLQVYDDIKQDYVRPSVDWIKANIGGLGGSTNGHTDITSSPHEFLINKCPNLINKDIIKLRDFNIKTNDRSGSLLRKVDTMSEKNAYVENNSIRYYIGRNNFIFDGKSIPMENIKVAILDDNMLGIIKSYKGRDSLLYTLKVFNEEEKKTKRQEVRDRKGDIAEKTVSALSIVGGEEVKKRITSWRPTSGNLKREDETPEDYAERIRYVGDYENLKQISDDFSRCGIGIHNLSWREQQWLCGAAYELGSKNHARLLEFGKQYGLEGLKTFLSCEYDINSYEKILHIGEKLNHNSAEAIFAKYNEIVELAEKTSSDTSEFLNKNEKITPKEEIKIYQDLLEKSRRILADFSNQIKNKKISEAEILKNLEKYKTDLILTASVFKALAGRGDIKLEDIKGVTFEQTTATEMAVSSRVILAVKNEIKTSKNLAIPASAFKGAITNMIKNPDSEEAKAIDEIVQMLYIYGENYKHKPEFSDKLLPGFLEKIKTGGDHMRVYKVSKDGELMAFYRFDDKEDGDKYFGSFNVNPVMQGSKIGTALMEESLKKEGAGCDVEADTDPETLVSSKYIEDEGFVATKVLKNYGGSSDSVFNIHRREENKKYYYRDQDYKSADIIRQYEKDFGGRNTTRPENKVIFKFSSPKEMLAAIEPLVNSGYTVSRYFYEDAKKDQTVYCALERSSN